MSGPLDRVAHLLVTPDNPPRDDVDGMDSERCAALHNAIYEHGWINSGRTAGSFLEETTTLWEHLDAETIERLHPSLQTFLREARTLVGYGQHTNFFYNVHGPVLSWDKDWYDPDPNRLLTLYRTYMAMATKPDGLVYDQHLHLTTMNFDLTDELELYPAQPWRKLEDILTVWIEMIQRSKVISVPSANTEMAPWKAISWTAQDLEECVELWGLIVEALEQKMGLESADASAGLLDAAILDAAQVPSTGFAREFLLRAKKPRFKFVAPGLRVPTAEEFIDQPFTHAPPPEGLSPGDIPPILLFRADAMISTAELEGFMYPYAGESAIVPECPCGLYIDHCDPEMPLPLEDGCRLVLPFKLEKGFAKQGDSSSVQGYDTLLQHGVNPYNVRHPLPFQAWLESIYHNIEDDNWAVDEHGVAGGIDVWRQADTEECWQD